MLLEEGANAADGAASAARRAADVIFIVFYKYELLFMIVLCYYHVVVTSLKILSRMLWKAMLCQKNNEWKLLLRFQVEEDRRRGIR